MTTPAIWIVNTSPFIGLAKIERLDLLYAPGRDVFLPQAVIGEIRAGAANDAAVRALDPFAMPKLEIRPLPRVVVDPRLSAFTLDAGEAAVLTEVLARPGSVAVIDDRPGRAAGKALGVAVTGTIGVLIDARREGRLPAMAPLIHALQAAGIFLPRDADLRALLATWGELWP